MAERAKRERVSGNIVQFTPDSEQILNGMAITNHAAEQAVISAVLRDSSVYASVSEILQPSDFHLLRHGYVWHAFDRLAARGEPIDTITVVDELDAMNYQPVSDQPLAWWVANLVATADRADSADAYARMVRDAATRLRMVSAAEAIKKVALNREKWFEIDAAIDEANRVLFAATDQQLKTEDTSMLAIVGGLMQTADDVRNGKVARGISYGYPNLDALLKVSVPGEVTIIAGASGMGKTTFCLGAARSLARQSKSIAVFTLEMSKQEITTSFVAMETGIAKRAFKDYDLTKQQWEQFTRAMGIIGNWNIHVIDEFPSLTPIQLRRRLRMMLQHQRIPLDLVIVDGLWLMEYADENGKTFSRSDDRPRAVGLILRDVIQIARAFNLPIWITHQYNDDAKKRNDKRPMMSDLAESSGVRRNSQVIVGLYRDSYYGITDGSGLTEAHILKDRNGSSAVGQHADFDFTGDRNLFTPFPTTGGQHAPF